MRSSLKLEDYSCTVQVRHGRRSVLIDLVYSQVQRLGNKYLKVDVQVSIACVYLIVEYLIIICDARKRSPLCPTLQYLLSAGV